MKKKIISFVLALVLALSMAGTAFASSGDGMSGPTIENLGANVTAELAENGKAVQLTVTGLTTGQQYLILMVSGTETDPEKVQISQSTILYIDQQADAGGSVSFKVYPSNMQTGTIWISGATAGLSLVATVTVPYLRGDADLGGYIDLYDATLTAKHAVGVSGATLSGNAFLAADADFGGYVDLYDATLIARYAVSYIWPN